MFIKELQETQSQTVGLGWRLARYAMIAVWLASGFVFMLASKNVGFVALGLSSILLSLLTGREYVISNLQRIRRITSLRERLLTLGEGEYVLQGIAEDQIWRGVPVDPDVTNRLTQYARQRNELTEQLMKFATELFNPNKVEDKTQN